MPTLIELADRAEMSAMRMADNLHLDTEAEECFDEARLLRAADVAIREMREHIERDGCPDCLKVLAAFDAAERGETP